MQGEGKSHEQGMKVRKDVTKSQHSQRKAAGPLFMPPPGKTKQNKMKKRCLKIQLPSQQDMSLSFYCIIYKSLLGIGSDVSGPTHHLDEIKAKLNLLQFPLVQNSAPPTKTSALDYTQPSEMVWIFQEEQQFLKL